MNDKDTPPKTDGQKLTEAIQEIGDLMVSGLEPHVKAMNNELNYIIGELKRIAQEILNKR